MIVFNEGLPRAGKSYDAVLSHLVPALAAGRHVYARLNGLDHSKIAAYLQVEVSEIVERLHLVGPDSKEGVEPSERERIFNEQKAAVYALADVVKPDSLIIIDECHDFYVSGRQELPPEQERFFAMHGHAGLDIVLISQFWKRLHSAVRGRVERKNLFRKMTAVGMKNRYVVAFYAAIAPDKFEKVGSEIRKYDPRIFDLYHGFAPGAQNVEVYDSGSKNAFSGKLKYVTLFLALAVPFGIYKLWGFFHGGIGKKPETVVQDSQRQHAVGISPVSAKPAPPPKKRLPSGLQYIVDLNGQARPRLAGWIAMEGRPPTGLVEWVSEGGVVLERMTLQQLGALGFTVRREAFGIYVVGGGEAWIATQWPRDFAGQYTEQDRNRIADAAAASPSVSESMPQLRVPLDATAPGHPPAAFAPLPHLRPSTLPLDPPAAFRRAYPNAMPTGSNHNGY